MTEKVIPSRILPLLVLSQFCGTSLWFAGNAILPRMGQDALSNPDALAASTSAVQFGFILGTLLFAIAGISDRFSAPKLFLLASVLGGASNLLLLLLPPGLFEIGVSRFLTGVCLAGIYPVGMKIAAQWYGQKLGMAMGFLVGALVLGTAFPHLLVFLGSGLSWQTLTMASSALALLGGIVMVTAVGEGPLLKKSPNFDTGKAFQVFRVPDFRKSALGYFGHMWELYAFWAFLPFFVEAYSTQYQTGWDTGLITFAVIATGGLACMAGGRLALRVGSKKVAIAFIAGSSLFCLISPLLMQFPPGLFITFLLAWGWLVAGDSPQFSTLSAKTAPSEWVGTALTISVCIGFFITILSIQLCKWAFSIIPVEYVFLLLAPGPLLGWYSASRIRTQM